MFLTAHSVETPEGHTGINAYLYLHFGDPVPTCGHGEPDVAHIAQFATGVCVATTEDVRPGGNTVKYTLDVAGADDTDAETIRGAIAQLKVQLRSKPPPVAARSRGAAAVFNATPGIDSDPEELLVVFEALASRAVDVNRQGKYAQLPSGSLVVWVHYRPDGIELSLPSATRARLGVNSMVHLAKILLPADVVAHFPGHGPSALIDVAVALTGKSLEQLRLAGGLSFLDPTAGTEVLRWPATEVSQVAERAD